MQNSRALGQAGLAAAAIVLVLSTQFLFQIELYGQWPMAEIVDGWLAYLTELAIAGGCILAAIAAAAAVRARPALSHVLLLAAIAIGGLAGEYVLLLRSPLPADVSTAEALLAKTLRWVSVGGLAYAAYVYRRRSAEAASRAHEAELQRVQLERQITEARLSSLRGQIEPHFLFNTLANVQRLYQTDPDRGRTMLASFVAYLRAALPDMRRDHTTLIQEIDLARAYLDVIQVRMGERLRFRLAVPSELAALPFPPLALSTLTENAVKHGLNPLPEGGSIEISAHIDAARLVVEVADTGAGLTQSGGTGSGLANLRARLAALYGAAANVELRSNEPRGIRATITVPLGAAA